MKSLGLVYKIASEKLKEGGYARLYQFCAEWTIEMLPDIDFKPIPFKPKPVLEYEAIPGEVRKRLNSDYFRDHPCILPYYKMRDGVKRENSSIYDWLVFCRKYLKPECVAKIDEKLRNCVVEQLWPERPERSTNAES